MPSPSLSPRPIFDPLATGTATPVTGAGAVGLRAGLCGIPATLLTFYRDPLSWLALAVTSAVLCYVGGLAMFWFHAVELGEGGPAISWYSHWLLDSTVGFVALTPALALIIPLAVHWSALVTGSVRPRLVLATYAVIAGGMFAIVTVPGPIVHNMFVGRGTWLADRMTAWIGDPAAPLPPAEEYSVSALLTQPLGAAVTIYLILTLAAVLLVRAVMTVTRRRSSAGISGPNADAMTPAA